jgi:hypothetical protein
MTAYLELYTFALLLSATTGFAMAVVARRRRTMPGGLSLALLMLSVT